MTTDAATLHQHRQTWRRMNGKHRRALEMLADAPAVAEGPFQHNRFWTLYRAPISRPTLEALDRAFAVEITRTGSCEAARISPHGLAILAAANHNTGAP